LASTKRYASGVTDPSYNNAPSSNGRRGHAGFTLLEMIVVIALMVIIAAMATLSFIGLEGESEVEKPGDDRRAWLKQAEPRGGKCRDDRSVDCFRQERSLVSWMGRVGRKGVRLCQRA